jgi:hypothetical protein
MRKEDAEMTKLENFELKSNVHRWRAETGIELIHEEPTLEEFRRVCYNWDAMSPEQKAISDAKSLELFGMTNGEHKRKLFPRMLMKKVLGR